MLYQKQRTVVIIGLFACALLTGAGVIAYNIGHQYHRNRTQFIRKHISNRVTIQVDSMQTGTFGTATGVGVGGIVADTLWTIRGTRIDTSVAFQGWPYMSHRFCFDNASDSVEIKARLWAGSRAERFTDQKLPPPFGSSSTKNYWALVDSVTFTGDKPVYKVWTANPIPNAPWFYLTLQGGNTNKKLTPGSTGTIVADHWDELPAR